MRAGDSSAISAYRIIGCLHGSSVQITKWDRKVFPELIGTGVETLQSPHGAMNFKDPVFRATRS
jgi:hypothetical protein